MAALPGPGPVAGRLQAARIGPMVARQEVWLARDGGARWER